MVPRRIWKQQLMQHTLVSLSTVKHILHFYRLHFSITIFSSCQKLHETRLKCMPSGHRNYSCLPFQQVTISKNEIVQPSHKGNMAISF